MIITKTPFRMSFFGGGTDMESYFRENGGAVLSTTFDKYCYVNVRHLPRFFDYSTELSYSKTERVTSIDDIQHPLIRNAMKLLDMQEIRLTYEADLPARSGLGTSSSFAVGTLNAFYALKGQYVDKKRLADEAIYLERVLCGEAGGWQDQIAAAFGGFNRINFSSDGYEVLPVIISPERKKRLCDSLLMFFTGFTRFSSEVQKALGRLGVLVLVAASGHRRKPGTGASSAGDLSIELSVFENPKLNRRPGKSGPTVTSVAEAAKDALHWREVEGRRIVYVEMQRTDADDGDYRMSVSFVAPLSLDPAHAVSWGIGDATILGEVTRKKVARAGVNVYEPGRDGDVRHVGTRDRHWTIDLTCTVTTQSEDDLPELGDTFTFGGRTYRVDAAELDADAEDTSTVRLAGRTLATD